MISRAKKTVDKYMNMQTTAVKKIFSAWFQIGLFKITFCGLIVDDTHYLTILKL